MRPWSFVPGGGWFSPRRRAPLSLEQKRRNIPPYPPLSRGAARGRGSTSPRARPHRRGREARRAGPNGGGALAGTRDACEGPPQPGRHGEHSSPADRAAPCRRVARGPAMSDAARPAATAKTGAGQAQRHSEIAPHKPACRAGGVVEGDVSRETPALEAFPVGDRAAAASVERRSADLAWCPACKVACWTSSALCTKCGRGLVDA